VGPVDPVRRAGLPYVRSMSAELAEFEAPEAQKGRALIYVAVASSAPTPLPFVALAHLDAPKRSSARAIRALQDIGIEGKFVTGEGRATAFVVAHRASIAPEGVWANMRPEGKALVVRELMGKGDGVVAMVRVGFPSALVDAMNAGGGGIDNSPALAAATVGIALLSGTSVAIEAADIVLMRSDLLDVIAALDLSRSIFRTIRRKLIWTCVGNVLGIPLAMGILPPLGLHIHPTIS